MYLTLGEVLHTQKTIKSVFDPQEFLENLLYVFRMPWIPVLFVWIVVNRDEWTLSEMFESLPSRNLLMMFTIIIIYFEIYA